VILQATRYELRRYWWKDVHLTWKKILYSSITTLGALPSYVHHILSRHLRSTSTVRKYIRYHVAYVQGYYASSSIKP
jgi:hypothetical protein